MEKAKKHGVRLIVFSAGLVLFRQVSNHFELSFLTGIGPALLVGLLLTLYVHMDGLILD